MVWFEAEDGIRDAQECRGLGVEYKRQVVVRLLGGVGRGCEEVGVLVVVT